MIQGEVPSSPLKLSLELAPSLVHIENTLFPDGNPTKTFFKSIFMSKFN